MDEKKDVQIAGTSRQRAMSTTMGLEVFPASIALPKPPQVVLPEDVEDQANAVPPEGEPQKPKDDDAASNVSSSLVPFQFRKFTKDSYKFLLEREAEEKRKAAEKKEAPAEGRLVDGELVYDGEEPTETGLSRDPTLVEGNQLPEHLEQDFPKDLLNQPLEEIDELLKDKTFVVITKRFKKTYIHRFSATSAFFILPPWNPIRRGAIYIATSQVFDYFIILTIITNCFFMAFPQSATTENAEYVFLTVYTLEAIVRLLSRGLFLNTYTYLRDGWNWLDFFVIIFAYVTYGLSSTPGVGDDVDLSVLRVFRVFRALKAVSIVPGLKTIIAALFSSMRMMAEVMFLLIFCMMVFALFTLQVYIGILRQKCVQDILPDTVLTDYEYQLYLKNSSNWLNGEEGGQLCGNASYAGTCPQNYTCLPNIGDNPNFGYTSFDNFGWAMLTSCQLITLDFWEDTYMKVIRTNGPSNVLFFLLVVFFGSFYLINLMLAVVSMSYEEEALNAGRLEKEKERRREKRERRERKEKERKEKAAAVAATTAAVVTEGTEGKQEDSEKKTEKGEEKKPSAANHGEGNMNASNSTKNPGNKVTQVQSLSVNEDTVDGKKSKGERTDFLEHMINGQMSKSKDAFLDPIVVDDNQSIISVENEGDIPDVTIKDDDESELVDRNCQCCARCCCGYPRWLTIQNFLYTIVTDIVFELFISFCIGLNVLGMMIEHHKMDANLEYALKVLNIVFTVIFTIEAILKIIAMGKYYFLSAWNIFDIIIVIVSYVDLGLQDISEIGFVKVIRIFRVLRVLKLAQTWSTMRVLISIMARTMGALGNLSVILFIIMYTCAVCGMQLFGKYYTAENFAPDDVPRWRFTSFGYSFMLVFRILCGEWIEPLWECMKAAGETCMVVFIPTLFIGNFVVLNLFLALMLNSFAADSLDKSKPETNEDKMKQGWLKIKGLFKKGNSVEPMGERRKSLADIVEELKRQQKAASDGDLEITENKSTRSSIGEPDDPNAVVDIGRQDDVAFNSMDNTKNKKNDEGSQSVDKKPCNGILKSSKNDEISEAFSTDRARFSEFPVTKLDKEENNKNNTDKKSESPKKDKKEKEKEKKTDDFDDEEEDLGIGECFPQFCCPQQSCGWYHRMDDTTCGMNWRKLRETAHTIAESKPFEYFVVLIILTSSFTLCFEDIYLHRKPDLEQTLYYLNIVFAVIFLIEMLLKWLSIGFKKYFSSFWTILDFCIVVVSVIDLAGESLGVNDVSTFRALRTLRALRPLRAISRWEGMRIVVNALAHAIPAIMNVILVCLILWVIFAIAGFQLFAGKFYKCLDLDSGEKLSHLIVPNKTVCLEMKANGSNYDWVNATFHFDNVISGLLSLLQIATFEGWMELMEDATDITNEDLQPIKENSTAYYIFFVLFIFLGSFFSLNLFIGVIIENFNMLKKKYEGGYLSVLLTPSQKNYYNTMKKLGTRKPQKTIKRPKNKIQGFFFDVAVSTKFELAIVVLILLNMFAMAAEHYRQSQSVTDALDIINIIFTTIFTLEAIVKIIGLRWHYFRRMWNVFDLIIVIVSIIGVVLADVLRDIFITPTLLRVVRVFRIGRVLRLIKAAKGIRKLLFALVISMPALLNIGTLLAIIVFMFAIFGMNFFGNIERRDAIDDLTNFETFANSLFLLIRLTTAAGWNDVLEPLMAPKICNDTARIMPDNGEVVFVSGGNCTNETLAGIFMALYIMVTYLIIINMYIAVILENFNQAHEQEEVGITEDDFEMFYVVWERYDPHATQFIKVEHLSDLVADLDLPLGIPKPNEIALVAFDLPIMEGERLHCLDILTALVKYVLGGVEDTSEFRNLKAQMEERYREAFPTRITQVTISTTMKRKKEDVAAKTLQRAWRKHKAQQSIRKITNMAMEAKLNKSLTRTSFSAASGSSPRHDRPSSSASSASSLKVSATARKLGNTLTVPFQRHERKS